MEFIRTERKCYEAFGGGDYGSGSIYGSISADYIREAKPRPETLTNKIGNYISRIIDTSINSIRGLLKKL